MKLLNQLKQQIQSQPFFNSPLYLKYQHLFIPMVVLIVALVISGLVTIPQIFKLFENFKTMGELNAQKSFLQQKTAKLQVVDTELFRKNLDTALLALPADKDIPGVTGELLVALSGSGLTLESIGFGGGSEESGEVAEFGLRFDVRGSEENLKSFLERVRLSPRIVKLTTIEVSKSRDTVGASISFVTLYQSLPEHIGTVDQSVPDISEKDLQALADIEAKAKALPQVAPSAATAVDGKLNPFAP